MLKYIYIYVCIIMYLKKNYYKYILYTSTYIYICVIHLIICKIYYTYSMSGNRKRSSLKFLRRNTRFRLFRSNRFYLLDLLFWPLRLFFLHCFFLFLFLRIIRVFAFSFPLLLRCFAFNRFSIQTQNNTYTYTYIICKKKSYLTNDKPRIHHVQYPYCTHTYRQIYYYYYYHPPIADSVKPSIVFKVEISLT